MEKIDSLENTLDFKRTELQEKQEQEELLQEKIMELNMEVNNLRMQPEDGTKKGNSLFAEVDDQRQKFRKLLNDQNDQYKQMKRAYQDGQLEIRRLRRENKEILEEMESCKELFKSSEAIFKQGLLEKIEILEQDREKQQQKMSKLEEAIASTPSTNWINTMLSYCRSETKTLKEKLFECLKQKSAIEESLLKSQQECAKFKFEASELKTKLRSSTESQVTTPPPPMEDDSMQEIDGNTEIDDSVQDFLKELSNEDRKENKKKKEEIDFKPYLSEPKFQSINVLQEKAENIVQTRNPAKKAPIVVKKIVIPSRAVKK
ncbi:protein Spindly [Culicoides brevitarsis]|uniref:protein Spindly n=1 Tax=Culicoides brevitarsis TaxID=469753 RepID=UPI00307BD4E2